MDRKQGCGRKWRQDRPVERFELSLEHIVKQMANRELIKL